MDGLPALLAHVVELEGAASGCKLGDQLGDVDAHLQINLATAEPKLSLRQGLDPMR
eukprot:CAMPEP_0115860392 /NCGR_PEP_ID=MMETSP0287-20121206/17103_1 /TAXON_ID=412157 /ORGANISM="Chrysochromulina rotalis, Strain UIO044" /LENGTH=55 /DNA_ID=CAMNT_0003314713 /DNA_START=287 /DNA_END=454 /DNA_ORIENTATION=+